MRIQLLLMAFVILTAGSFRIFGADDCDTAGQCKLPGSVSDAAKSGVLSPVGQSTIAKIKKSRKLPALLFPVTWVLFARIKRMSIIRLKICKTNPSRIKACPKKNINKF